MDLKNAVIIRIDPNGDNAYYVCGDVRMFIVDERCRRDRVYEWLPRDDASVLAGIIGDSLIGSSEDDRHSALKAVIQEAVRGKPRLSIVDPDPNDERLI